MLQSYTHSKESPLNYDSVFLHELKSLKCDDKTKKHRILITDIKELQVQKQSLPSQLTAVKNQRKQISVDNADLFSLAGNNFLHVNPSLVSPLWHTATTLMMSFKRVSVAQK